LLVISTDCCRYVTRIVAYKYRTHRSLSFVPWGLKLLVLGIELDLCHPSGIHNFDVPLIFLVHLCTPVLDHKMSCLKESVCFVSAHGTRDEISILCVWKARVVLFRTT
jgi:hypothetical protein